MSEEDNWRNIWIEFPENSKSDVTKDTVGCGWSVLRSHLLFTGSFVDHEGRKLRVGVDLGMKVTDTVNLLFFVFLNKFATVKNGQDLVGKSEGSNFWIKM